jgi:muconate cycloisomerase
LKIVAAEVQSLRIPVIRPHPMAIGTTHFQENVVVKLLAENGEAGYGEAPHMVGHSQLGETPHTVRVILRHKLLPATLGQNPLNQEALALALDRAVPGNQRAKGALMMAAYDLAGRLLDTPVYNLLGGKVRDRVPLSWSLPIVDARVAIEEGLQMIERGLRILKIKVGRPDPDQDVAVVAAVRDAIGQDIRLRIDANQAYEAKTALRVLRGVEPYGIDFFEQPVHRDDLDGMATVTRHSPIPIMADESLKSPADLALVARKQAADYASIYIIGPGGPLHSKKMAAIAEAHRMRAYVGGALESIIGVAAGLHVAASSPAIDLGCELYAQFMLKEDVGRQPFTFEDGALLVPDGPGLGFQVDERVLERYRQGELERFGSN